MNKILIIGATGSLAQAVIAAAEQNPELQLTLLARNPEKLSDGMKTRHRVVQGSALNINELTAAIKGQDVVYLNLAGDLGVMARNIVQAMQAEKVRRLIAISSIGIYDEPVKAVLKPYRELADVVEQSGLDYTILRPDWFTSGNEIDYALTPKNQTERGGAISRKSIADFVCKLFVSPDEFVGENLNISKV